MPPLSQTPESTFQRVKRIMQQREIPTDFDPPKNEDLEKEEAVEQPPKQDRTSL
jgi:hypothetical protein